MHIQHNNRSKTDFKKIEDKKPKHVTIVTKKDNVIKNYVYYLEPIRVF